MRLKPEPRSEPLDSPLRVCLITYRGNPTCGGQGVYVKRIARILADRGHEVHVVSGPPYPELDERIPLHRLPSLDLYNPEALFRVPSLRELATPVNLLEWLAVSSGGFPEPYTFGVRAYRFFRDRCPVRFDILHDNQSLAYGLLKVRRLGLPLVATIHHPITYDLKAELEQQPVRWKRLKIRRWYSFVRMQVRVARKLSHIITVSESARRDTAASFRIPVERFRVVQNGIDTDLFRPHPEVKRDPQRIIVTNSADSPVKGVRYLLEAVASIARTRDVRLTVIGTPKKHGVVERLVRDLDLARHVEFAGRVEDEDFPLHYARASLAVVASIYEGFGFPAGEAMACGTPVVATTGGALPEVVGDAGVLVPPADAGALERAILDLLDHPRKREALSRAGYERIHKHFTWERAADKIVAVYREVIRDHRGLRPH